MRLARKAVVAVAAVVALLAASPAGAQEHRGRGRIVILMVWDGLRPDAVTQRDTPNLYRMAREGVRFDRHHSIYPTVTMANAGALSTGAPPGITGLEGNVTYVANAPNAAASAAPTAAPVAVATSGVLYDWRKIGSVATPTATPAPAAPGAWGRLMTTEISQQTIELNGPAYYAGRILGLDTIAQEVEREGGYIAALGKPGPALMFDNRLKTVADGKDLVGEPHQDFFFLSDDLGEPGPEAARLLAALPPEEKSGVIDGARDAYFTAAAIEQALPAARRAAEAGRPALIVLWQHNPDVSEHLAGLGTAPAIEALHRCDDNLGKLRAAIEAAGIAGRTDLIVVSDHGFATIRMRVDLSALLVSAGIKRAADSADIVVAPNGGSDFVYVSPAEFPTPAARHAVLQKVVDFAEAQEWCGPIFARDAAPVSERTRGRHDRRAPKPYLGWIDGTFSQAAVGLYNPARSPDLIVSMNEIPNVDNQGFTGPDRPAFIVGASGQVATPNRSQPLVRPVKGLVYADNGPSTRWTAGMGMHGAAGEREIHNFCAAAGPGFRRGFVDINPTANTDIAPTIAQILGLAMNRGPGGAAPTGHPLAEALVEGRRAALAARTLTMTTALALQGVEALATIRVIEVGGQSYLDSASVERRPLGSSP